MARNEPMLVLFFLVLSLDDHVPVGGPDGDFLRRELLHVQDDLVFVLFEVQRRTGILPGQGRVAPRPVVAGTEQRRGRGPGGQRAEQVVDTG